MGERHSDISSQPASAPSANEIELAKRFEEGFRVLFTEVIIQSPSGTWSVSEKGLAKHPDISRSGAISVASAMNGPEGLAGAVRAGASAGSINFDEPVITTHGATDYAKCVLKGVVPGGLIAFLDWRAISSMIQQKAWPKLGLYIGKHAAKHGMKDAVKLTPGGLALSVIGSAAGCAVWG
ncbi:hypothetical protein [Austwickia chelonae]|uniref:hypothetical protein n=1 Tax=Austwickia chelonae TaxID=100225 RepID=UPI0013C2B401|nr:hypothetical protein [Austwickia chelonae]